MCNRYRAASVVRIRDAFGFTYIESGPPLQERYRTTGIGPLQAGPFVRRGHELVVGQWGLTPDGSGSLQPLNSRTGRPISTNNCRIETVAADSEARVDSGQLWQLVSARSTAPTADRRPIRTGSTGSCA